MRLTVAALLLAAALGGCVRATPGLALPDRFTALGTEPFWAAKVDGSRLTYSTPLDQKGRTMSVTRSRQAGSARIEGLLDGRVLRLVVTAGPCSDGMSDSVYPLTVERTFGDSVHAGCARPD